MNIDAADAQARPGGTNGGYEPDARQALRSASTPGACSTRACRGVVVRSGGGLRGSGTYARTLLAYLTIMTLFTVLHSE